jgi:hypothetical protein
MKPAEASAQSQPLDRRHLWSSFCNDLELRTRHHITEAEIQFLHTVFLLGDYRDKHALIEALERLRRGWHS